MQANSYQDVPCVYTNKNNEELLEVSNTLSTYPYKQKYTKQNHINELLTKQAQKV